MGTRMNPMAGRYFNDPSFASAVSNLASAFGPPSPEEYLVGEQLRGARLENDGREKLFTLAGDDFDRLGMVSDLWDPTQSLYRVDQDNATARYGIDSTATTSRLNNAADNDTAVRTAVFDAAANPSGSQAMDAELLNSIFGTSGLPTLPGAGPVAPSTDQVKGGLLADAKSAGMITAQDAADAYTSDIPVEQIIMEGADVPTIVRRSDAVGQQPYINKGAEAAPQAITFERAGQRVGGFVVDGQFVDVAGQPLTPEEAGTAAKIGSPEGSNEALGITTGLETEYGRIQRTVLESNLLLDDLDGLIRNNVGAAGAPGAIQRIGQDLVQVGLELGAVFGGDANSVITEDQLAQVNSALGNTGGYDPVFQEIRTGLLQLAYLNAKRDKGGGDVSRFDLERQIEALGQGMLGNDESVLAAIGMNRRANDRALKAAEALVGRTRPDINGGALPGVSAEELDPDELQWLNGGN